MTSFPEESAEAESGSLKVYIGLGSNIGDREANLREAAERVKALEVNIICQSSIYETEPVGYADQSWFLNQVIEAMVSPEDDFRAVDAALHQSALLLAALHRIEDEMGRKRSLLNGPRIIDIDLLLFGDLITPQTADQESASIHPIIPHPRMHLRRFVLEPLLEIAPDIRWPQSDRKIADTLDALDDSAIARIYKRNESV